MAVYIEKIAEVFENRRIKGKHKVFICGLCRAQQTKRPPIHL